MATILWVASRYWIPKANSIRSDFQNNYLDKNDPTKNRYLGNCSRCFYRRTDPNTFVGIRDYDTASKSAQGFFLNREKDNKLVYNLRAQTIRWEITKKKWQLINAAERRVNAMGETLKLYDTVIINLSLKPEELVKDEYLKDKLTTPELAAFIQREELRASEGLNALKVEMYRRTATPFAVFLLTMIGVVIASRKTRGGSGMHLAMGIIIAALFIISDRFSTVFATKGSLPPMLAAWLPNIFFTIVAYLLYRRTPK